MPQNIKFTKHRPVTVHPGRIPTAKRKSLPVCRTENQFPMAPSPRAGLVISLGPGWARFVVLEWQSVRAKKKAKNSEINSPLPLLAARPGRWRKSKKQKSLFIYLFSYKIGRFDCIYFARTFFFPKPHHFGTLDPGPPDGVRVSRGFYEDRPGLEGMEKAFALISAYGPTGSKKCGFIECIIIWKWCWSVRKFQLPLERFPWAT